MAEDKKTAPKTKKYKLLARQHSGAPDPETGAREEYTTGDMVPLTDRQYEVFKDKFDAHDPDKDKDEPTTSASQPQIPAGAKPDTVAAISKEGETKPSGTQTGAGAAANSDNTKKV